MQRSSKQLSQAERLISGQEVVLHIVQALRGGGAQTLVRELVPRLRKRGVDARVLCAYGSSQLTVDESTAWNNILYTEPRLGIPRVKYLNNLRRQVRAIDPLLVHTHTHAGSIWGRTAAVLEGVPSIVHTEHDSTSSLPLVELLSLRFLNARTAAVVAFSERSAKLLQRREKISKPRVIPNGLQIRKLPTSEERRSSREKLGVRDDRIIIAIIASLEPYKNPMLALESIPHLSDSTRPKVRLVFFGDGSLKAALARRADELQISSSVDFFGFRNDLAELLPGCDLVLSTSEREMMPFSYLEAMNCGIPIIGTPHGGTLDLVIDKETGIILKGWDPSLVAEAIEWVVARPEWRQRAADAAHTLVAEKFDIESVADRYLGLYQEVLKQKLSK